MEKKGRNFEELKWKRVDNLPGIPYRCDCSLNDLNRELKCKDELITKM